MSIDKWFSWLTGEITHDELMQDPEYAEAYRQVELRHKDAEIVPCDCQRPGCVKEVSPDGTVLGGWGPAGCPL